MSYEWYKKAMIFVYLVLVFGGGNFGAWNTGAASTWGCALVLIAMVLTKTGADADCTGAALHWCWLHLVLIAPGADCLALVLIARSLVPLMLLVLVLIKSAHSTYTDINGADSTSADQW